MRKRWSTWGCGAYVIGLVQEDVMLPIAHMCCLSV